MNDGIYREESVEQLKSPDDLKQCIKIASPGMWLMLGAILIFLIGGCIWCIFAKLETKVDVAVEVKNGSATCYVSENDMVEEGMHIIIEGQDYILNDHSEKLKKLQVEKDNDDAILHTMDRDTDGWYVIYELNGLDGIEDGLYRAEVVVDSVSPLSFLTNGK